MLLIITLFTTAILRLESAVLIMERGRSSWSGSG